MRCKKMRKIGRGFTLTEIVVALMVVSIVGALAVPTYMAVTGSKEDEKSTTILTGYVAKARSIASRPGNQYRYPADVVAQLTALDTKITAGDSYGAGIVSARRIDDETILLVSANDRGWCYAILDSIANDTQTYAYDKTPDGCNATNVVHTDITGTLATPAEIDIL